MEYDFIERAKVVHGDRYDYKNTIYEKKNKNVLITCKEHGEFSQTPYSHLRGSGCPYCTGNKVNIHNCLYTLAPNFVTYFKNKEESKEVTIRSDKKVELVCPECNFNKTMRVANLVRQGFSCNQCSDGFSTPQKFVINALQEIGIQFEPEKAFEWSLRKRYDIYIPSRDMIIEVHGRQHYEPCGRGKLLEDEINNDKLKEKLAKENNIVEYVIVDARNSTVEWLIENIDKSIGRHFDFSGINFLEIFKKSQSSIVLKVWSLYNQDKQIDEIASILKLKPQIVYKYVSRGIKLNICKKTRRIGNITNCRKVSQYNKDGVFIKSFNSIREAHNITGVSESGITSCCSKNRIKSSGGYIWKYYEI